MSWVRGNGRLTIPARTRPLDFRYTRNSPQADFVEFYPTLLCQSLEDQLTADTRLHRSQHLAWQQDPAFAEKNLIFSLSNFEKGRVWTLVVALFVHANVLHLLGNMLFLFVFGNTLEKTVGAQKLLAIFFTGGFLSFILGPAFLPSGTGMLGASAAIFALAGASCSCDHSDSHGFFSRRRD
jgi:membrane associated rhomboid family serine protease